MENRHPTLSRLRPEARAVRPRLALSMAAAAVVASAHAAGTDGSLAQQIQAWTQPLAAAMPGLANARVDVEVGRLDPRLRLAPCERVEPYLPSGSRPWGRSRVGLRCVEGPSRWNVFLPVTVRLWAPAPVLREPRPAGHVLAPSDFVMAETDWAERVDAPLARVELMVGRALSLPVAAGQPVRSPQLQQRQWFAAGDTVRIVARGRGYSVSGEGQALTRGLDGETARVRTAGGRVVTGVAVAAHKVEIAL